MFHTNEGHAGFLGLERIRELMTDAGLSFAAALEAVRAGTVFTTHTPVPAGIDRFDLDLIRSHFGGDRALPGVPLDDMLPLGAETYPGGDRKSSTWRSWVCAWPSGPTASPLLHGQVSRGCSPASGRVSTPARFPSRRSPTGSRTDMGGTRGVVARQPGR